MASLFPKQNYNALSPNFRIHVSVSDLYIPTNGLSSTNRSLTDTFGTVYLPEPRLDKFKVLFWIENNSAAPENIFDIYFIYILLIEDGMLMSQSDSD
jgi:hypothetical protein